MKRIIPFAPLYTINEYGRAFGPTGKQLDYEVRQNRFGDVLTVAIGEGNEMSWHPVIDLVSSIHFDSCKIVTGSGMKLSMPGRNSRPPWLVLDHHARTLPRLDACIEIWYRYQVLGHCIPQIYADLSEKIEAPVLMYRDVVAAALIAGMRV